MKKKELELIIIPFAGGGANSMIPLAQEFRGFCRVHTLELPGRGKRIVEPLLTDINEMVEDLYQVIMPKLDKDKEYCVFGHSMGSLLGILLVHRILEEDNFHISHFFGSGRGGPSLAYENDAASQLPSKEFREKLRELGGSPDEVLAHEDLMEVFEPIIRADFKAIEEYQFNESIKLDIHITGFYGSEEKVKEDGMKTWQLESNFPVELVQFEGNHFFLFNWAKEISEKMKQRMEDKSILSISLI
ncbi:thioesterase II family protein [Chryseobacterium sp. JV558]|uniref:thioesterase II family protein n=1 Tax=Chryseobacterium sp. JV558 TaxID=2663236 RepID=UPI00299EDCF4|nr:thioesterase domain-containing protein [Chryseobacterium sp. JV558]MDW9383020.1 hypothetical protein [Chryseobacterium sp. JV558]